MTSRRRRPGIDQLGFDFGAAPEPQPAAPVAPPAPVDSATPLERALRLESNLALFAGAGAGKTYSLITIALHVLAGARAGREPVPPSNLCLLTFTDKAAAEMRQRLRDRLDALARGEGAEPLLEASFAALSKPFPPKAFWRSVRDDLGLATIGTFHSVMTQVLRRAPSGSGVNPSFDLLEEREGKQLFSECVERVVFSRLEQADPHVRALVRDFGFGSDSPWGLVSALTRAAAAIREEGIAVDLVPVQDESEAGEAFLAAIRGLRHLAIRTQRGLGAKHPQREAVDEICRRLAEVTLETWPEHRDALETLSQRWRREDVKALRDALKGTSDGTGSVGALWVAWRMAPFDATVRAMVKASLETYEAALDERGALDFTGLLVRARNLLRESQEARADLQRRFQVVLVDEFQDTNRVQLDLVLLFAERREGAPRPLSREFDEGPSNEALTFPLEPASLAVVGDRKQAIYDFRGADVAVFEQMARCIEQSGGQRQYLQHSRRSTADLVEWCNQTSRSFLRRGDEARGALPFEVEFDMDTDALAAVRVDAPPGPALVRLSLPEKFRSAPNAPPVELLRDSEADALARALAAMLNGGRDLVVPRGSRDGAARAVQGSDVAILFQRFTQVEVYRQALVRHGVRHRLVRGRGFYAAQEVVDLASLLQLVADPSDAVACAAVLRSPLVGLSDRALVSLALEGEQVKGLEPGRLVLQGAFDDRALTDRERNGLTRFLDVFRTLRRERDRLGLRNLLRVALDSLDFRVAVAASPFGEQGLANLDKLLDLAHARDASGVPLAGFARELLELAESEPSEAQGEVLDEQDHDAVTVLTVHQAKGLEWPVVVLPELFALPPPGGERVRFDRAVGLAVAPLAGEPTASVRYLQSKALKARRDEAQRRRLLYVALTRARDRVVLGFQPPKAAKSTWSAWLSLSDIWFHEFHRRGLVEDVDVDALPPGRAATAGEADESALQESAAAAVERARRPAVGQPRDVMLPVTQLQDFVLCPRRFHLAHQVGLQEWPVSFEWADEALDEGDAFGSRRLGTAVHRLLERVPLAAIGHPSLMATLEALHRSGGLPTGRDEDVVRWASAFLATPYGRRLPAAKRVLREVPFVLRLGDGGFSLHLRGQIDLLVIDETVDVVDYKTSVAPPAGLAPYRFQLGCYVLASRRLMGEQELPVRAGVSFLRSDDASPRFMEGLDDAALEEDLVRAARALVQAQSGRDWARRPRPTCEALGCGYVARCHG